MFTNAKIRWRLVLILTVLCTGFLLWGYLDNFRGAYAANEPASGLTKAFPGAEGFASKTPAGRCGDIIKVTNLLDDGPGSLRVAIQTNRPRIVVFEISGTVVLTKDIVVTNPYLTISGQTSPSPGITLRGGTLSIETHDVLIQHIRVRAGDEASLQNRSSRDGITIQNAMNVIIDHCSVSWAIDENICIKHSKNVTISNCLIAEGLNDSYNKKGKHSKAILISYDANNVTLLKNIFAHHADRHPNVKDKSSAISANNLYYNFGYRAASFSAKEFPCQDEPCVTFCSVGDVYIAGLDSDADKKGAGNTIFRVHPSVRPPSKIYIQDTLIIPNSIQVKSGGTGIWVTSPPFWESSLICMAADLVQAYVLTHSGARPADRDTVDMRVIEDVKKRTGRIIDSQRDVGGWPLLQMNHQVFTIPDNPDGDIDRNGYTNIEEALQRMAAEVEQNPKSGDPDPSA